LTIGVASAPVASKMRAEPMSQGFGITKQPAGTRTVHENMGTDRCGIIRTSGPASTRGS